jgi:hypothetical protein
MTTPVLAGDGNYYEKEGLKNWFKTSCSSPVTRQELNPKEIMVDEDLKAYIQEYLMLRPNRKPQ